MLEAIKDDVRTARRRAVRVVNTALLELYHRDDGRSMFALLALHAVSPINPV